MRTFVASLVLLVPTVVVGDDPTPLDKIDPAKVPALLRPKGFPEEVLAVLSQRGDKIDCLAVNPGGRYAVFGGPDWIVRVWDLEKLRLVATSTQKNFVSAVAISQDTKLIAAGDANGNVRVLRFDGTVLGSRAMIAAHKDSPVWNLAFSADGNKLFSSAKDKTITVWDLSKAKPVKLATLTGHNDSVRGMSLHADGGLLASVGYTDKSLRLWDVTAEKTKMIANIPQPDRVVSVAFAPDGKTLAVGGSKGVPAIWTGEGAKWAKTTDLDTDNRAATSISFSADGSLLCAVAAQTPTVDRVIVWNKSGEKVTELQYDKHLSAVAFAGDSRHLFVLTETDTLLVRIPKEK